MSDFLLDDYSNIVAMNVSRTRGKTVTTNDGRFVEFWINHENNGSLNDYRISIDEVVGDEWRYSEISRCHVTGQFVMKNTVAVLGVDGSYGPHSDEFVTQLTAETADTLIRDLAGSLQ